MRLAAPEQETELHAGVSPEARTGGGGGRGGPEVHREGPSPNKIKSQCRRGKRRVLWPKFHPQMRTWGHLREPTPRHALRSPSVPCPRGARLRPLTEVSAQVHRPTRSGPGRTRTRGHFLVFIPPSARLRPPSPPRPSSPEKSPPARGQAASAAGAPGLLPGWPPAQPEARPQGVGSPRPNR